MQNLQKNLRNLWPHSDTPEPWQITAARFCVSRETFTQEDIISFITSLGQHREIAIKFFSENIIRPSGSPYTRDHVSGLWFAPTELVSMVTDYDELNEARRNAANAQKFALSALVVSGAGVLLQVLAL